MNTKRFLVLGVIAFAFILGWGMYRTKTMSGNKPASQKLVSAPLTPLHVARENVTVWLDTTRLDVKEAFDSLDDNRKQIGTVSPVMYQLTDGKVVFHHKLGVNTKDDIVFACNKNEPKIAIRPVFRNVDEGGVHGDEALKILQNPALREAALDEIVKVAKDPNYAGVDLDWEGIPTDKFHLLSDFVEELAPRVHRVGKTLSVAVEAQVGGIADNWKRISEVADRVEIICYPQHHRGTDPGPIASVEWTEYRLKEALKVIPRSKLVFCLPLFGYVWEDWATLNPERKSYDILSEMTWLRLKDIQEGEKRTRGTDWYNRNSISPLENKRDKEGNPSSLFKHDTRRGDQAKCEAWYEDAYSINIKILMAQKYRVSQFGFWRIGGEDPDVWKSLN